MCVVARKWQKKYFWSLFHWISLTLNDKINEIIYYSNKKVYLTLNDKINEIIYYSNKKVLLETTYASCVLCY